MKYNNVIFNASNYNAIKLAKEKYSFEGINAKEETV